MAQSNSCTAVKTCWYLPMTTSRNEPLIPGKIIAHIATMPASVNL